MILSSCGITKRDFDVEPSVNIPDDYLEETLEPEIANTSEVIQNWWSNFNDPVLNTLIEKARQHGDC